jgi:ElaB/YqjD/DUF883 family membrane-anchored ribosome-binding protein
MSEANDPTAKAEEAADATAEKARETAEAAWNTAKDKLGDLKTIQKYAEDNPIQALLIAFGLGFILALILRK